MGKRLAFMDPLVLAVAADEKTVTRRMTDPRFRPGDVVDVCEALVRAHTAGDEDADVGYPCIVYRADRGVPRRDGWAIQWPWKVNVLPARYCPTWAVRHRVEILDVRPEPLSVCTDEDAGREGIARMGLTPDASTFLRVFREIHGLAADADPTVFRVEFRRVGASR